MLRIRKETPAATQPFGRRPTKRNGANNFINNLSRVIFHVAFVHEGKKHTFNVTFVSTAVLRRGI